MFSLHSHRFTPWDRNSGTLYGWLVPTFGMYVVKSRKICRRSNPIFSVVQSVAYSRYRLESFVTCWNRLFINTFCYCRISHLFDTSRIRQSQWPRGLRRRHVAALLLRLWVQSHWGHGCLSVVSVVCCQVEVSATS